MGPRGTIGSLHNLWGPPAREKSSPYDDDRSSPVVNMGCSPRCKAGPCIGCGVDLVHWNTTDTPHVLVLWARAFSQPLSVSPKGTRQLHDDISSCREEEFRAPWWGGGPSLQWRTMALKRNHVSDASPQCSVRAYCTTGPVAFPHGIAMLQGPTRKRAGPVPGHPGRAFED